MSNCQFYQVLNFICAMLFWKNTKYFTKGVARRRSKSTVSLSWPCFEIICSSWDAAFVSAGRSVLLCISSSRKSVVSFRSLGSLSKSCRKKDLLSFKCKFTFKNWLKCIWMIYIEDEPKVLKQTLRTNKLHQNKEISYK